MLEQDVIEKLGAMVLGKAKVQLEGMGYIGAQSNYSITMREKDQEQ